MQTATNASAPSEYRVLAEKIRQASLLKRRPWIYSVRIALSVGGFAAGWTALFVIGDSWFALGVAAFLGLVFTHIVFLGHEAGHQQIFDSRPANRLVGLVAGNVLAGLSFSWWVPKHNAHHAYPNQVGRDPDIGPIIIVPLSNDQSVLHVRDSRLLLLRRALLFLPLSLLEVGMHLTSGKALAQRRGHDAAVEWLLLAVHAVLYLAAVIWVLSPLRAMAFIVIQQGVFGLYLRLAFAPNHKGMPILEHDTDLGFVQRQVITSRNLTGGRVTTFMLGGLNYQIEHHLFPTMPRPNLVRAQNIIRAFCAECGLDYREDSLFDSYRQAFNYLRSGQAERAPLQVMLSSP